MSSGILQLIWSSIGRWFVSAFSDFCPGFCSLFARASWRCRTAWSHQLYLRCSWAGAPSFVLDQLVVRGAAGTLVAVFGFDWDTLCGTSPVILTPLVLSFLARRSTDGGRLLQSLNSAGLFCSRSRSKSGSCLLMPPTWLLWQDWAPMKPYHFDRRVAGSLIWASLVHCFTSPQNFQRVLLTETMVFCIEFQDWPILCNYLPMLSSWLFELSLLLYSGRILRFASQM